MCFDQSVPTTKNNEEELSGITLNLLLSIIEYDDATPATLTMNAIHIPYTPSSKCICGRLPIEEE